MNSIPIDLFHEIFTRLPTKAVGKCRCVSKQWESILSRKYFTELFLTRSTARPRLLYVVERDGEWLFFSSPQPQNPSEKSSLVVDFHVKFRLEKDQYRLYHCEYTSGLVYFLSRTTYDYTVVPVICNPITGQHAVLPKLSSHVGFKILLGFDPIDRQFKVLFMSYNCDDNKILTVRTGKLRWRKIQCPLVHYPLCDGICINGVLYYLAHPPDPDEETGNLSIVIVCFDVRSENFKFVDGECSTADLIPTLINYKGKLGRITLTCDYNKANTHTIEFCICVLEDVEKQEWSKHVHTAFALDMGFNDLCGLYVLGMTATGEIFLSGNWEQNVFYFYRESSTTLQSVEIQGVGEYKEWFKVYPFLDHVEDLGINDAKILKSNITDGKMRIRKRRRRRRSGEMKKRDSERMKYVKKLGHC